MQPLPAPAPQGVPAADAGQHDAVPVDQSEDHTPPQPHPTSAPTGRRRRAVAPPSEAAQAPGAPEQWGPRPRRAPRRGPAPSGAAAARRGAARAGRTGRGHFARRDAGLTAVARRR